MLKGMIDVAQLRKFYHRPPDCNLTCFFFPPTGMEQRKWKVFKNKMLMKIFVRKRR